MRYPVKQKVNHNIRQKARKHTRLPPTPTSSIYSTNSTLPPPHLGVNVSLFSNLCQPKHVGPAMRNAERRVQVDCTVRDGGRRRGLWVSEDAEDLCDEDADMVIFGVTD
jgi:hypothetical protein